MLRAFLDGRPCRPLPSVRRVVCSGEALPAEPGARVCASASGPRLHNLYGPTEAAVDVDLRRRCEPATADASPIGRPDRQHPHLRARRRRCSRCRSASPGELLHRRRPARPRLPRTGPALTAERFVPDPFGGDRARGSTAPATWPATGRTAPSSYLGRVDHQVKIRGYRDRARRDRGASWPRTPRVTRRRRHGRSDRRPAARLVGYVVPAARAGGSGRRPPAGLRSASGCPTHMVPGDSSSLDALPLTADGKVDREALPAPDRTPAAQPRPVTSRAPHAEERASPASGAPCWASTGSASTTASSTSAATRCAPSAWWARCGARAGRHRAATSSPTARVAALAARYRAPPGSGADARPLVAPSPAARPADRARLPDGLADAYPLAIQPG